MCIKTKTPCPRNSPRRRPFFAKCVAKTPVVYRIGRISQRVPRDTWRSTSRARATGSAFVEIWFSVSADNRGGLLSVHAVSVCQHNTTRPLLSSSFALYRNIVSSAYRHRAFSRHARVDGEGGGQRETRSRVHAFYGPVFFHETMVFDARVKTLTE